MRTNDATPNLFLLLKAACHQITTRAAAHAERVVGVHGAQALALLAIAESEPCSVGRLAGAVGLKMSAAASLASRLAREGLVERAPNPDDGRAVLLSLSPRGRTTAAEVAEMVEGFDRALREGFAPEELAVVERFLAASGGVP